MRIFHLSDLHIGKSLITYDLFEVQRDMLNKIVEYAKGERPDAILVSGDVYDKSVPSADAAVLFDEFLNNLAEIKPHIPVLIISGNHDSTKRLGFAKDFLAHAQIYIAAMPPTAGEKLKKIVLEDEYGVVNFYLCPFIRPADARRIILEEGAELPLINNYDEAIEYVLGREAIDYSERNVILTHQFYVGSDKEVVRRDSEQMLSVGGIDSVDIRHIEHFDYCALGHIHTSQKVVHEHIRYSGTPLKYSVSECGDKKSITVVDIREKGSKVEISYLPLDIKPDVKQLKGSLDEIIAMWSPEIANDYVSIILTDEEILLRPKERLEEFYKNILEIKVENKRTQSLLDTDDDSEISSDVFALFSDFYQEMNGQPMTKDESDIFEDVVAKIVSGDGLA